MRDLAIALFTRDLRVHDNPVLTAAARSGRVVPLFVLDDDIARTGFLRPNRATFLLDSLADLDKNLRDLGGALVVRRGSVVDVVRRVAEETGAGSVHIASDATVYAQRRSHRLARALAADGRQLVVHPAAVAACEPGEIVPLGADHFAIFTPYYRRWLDFALRMPVDAPDRIVMPGIDPGELPAAEELCPGPRSPHLPRGGERAALRRLAEWVETVPRYATDSDQLPEDGTSRLSPYLHFGCVSAVEVVNRVGAKTEGAVGFLRSLAWRDFYQQLVAARPSATTRDYQGHDDRWREDPEAFRAWRLGRTGYPIVDAGMRQLATEGWMHNRARLIVGSFLTKTLYLDWRLGADHFLQLLVDGDRVNNQLNWQWVAGTGTDTRPYRMINPVLQAKRHDPDGVYVRRYVPELAGIRGAAVHEPWLLPAGLRRTLDYPDPIVDLDEGRARFRAARKGA